MRVKTNHRFLLTVALGALLAMPLLSCDGDGVGLDKNGDPLAEENPITTEDSVATLLASKDNTLYESTLGNISNGSGQYFFAGQTAVGGVRRGLLAFDVAGTIPTGATITGATLTLQMSRETASSGAESMTLHRVTESWGEGTSDAAGEEGSGTAAATGDATWLHAMFSSVFWSTVGGSFSATASASQTVDAIGTYTWSGPQMAADIQQWLDSPSTNFGWMLRGNEGVPASAKRFNSRENAVSPPELSVEFTF